MRRTTIRARWLRAVFAMATLCSIVAGGGGPAHAEEDGRPWFPMIEPDRSPREIYEQNALSVIRIGGVGWRVNRGVYRASVTRHDFYVTVGRKDLASSESSSRATSGVLLWGGGAALLGGVVWTGAAIVPGGLEPPTTPGLILMGGGLVAILVGAFVDGPSLTQDEVETMVDRYNDRLRAHIERESGSDKHGPVQARLPLLLPMPWTDGRSGFGLMTAAVF